MTRRLALAGMAALLVVPFLKALLPRPLEDPALADPELLVAGDERASALDFALLSRAFRPEGATGQVWTGEGATALSLLERLEARRVRPGTLILAAPLRDPGKVVEAIRRIRAAGTRVVLLRLPVDQETLDREDRDGEAMRLEEVREGTGVPVIDMNRLPGWPFYREAVEDGRVRGEEACRRLSEEVGRRARGT